MDHFSVFIMAQNFLCDLALAYISNLVIDTKTVQMIGKET